METETQNVISSNPNYNEILVEQKPSIKLIKETTAKGMTKYSWEIKIIGLDTEQLKTINDILLKDYPGDQI